MRFLSDPRRRSVALLTGLTLLFFAVLGVLQWFNTSSVGFLNPETYGETLAFTGLTCWCFCLLMVLLMLLLRNILKLYADQSSSALGARLRTRMVLGAALIALTPAVFMFLFSFQLHEPLHRPLVFAQHIGVARGLDAGGAGAGAICDQQRARGGGVDCGFRRSGSGAAGASGRVERASHYAGGRLCDCLWQGSAHAGRVSGAAGEKPCQPASLDGRRRARRSSHAQRAALCSSVIGGAAQRSAGDEGGGAGVCAGHGANQLPARWWWWRCRCRRD